MVKDDGTKIRQLNDGESVRAKSSHVEIFPHEEDLKIIFRILKLLPDHSASEVGRILDSEGIPSPDAGRTKKVNGVEKKVSGKWNSTTIIDIARNPYLLAISSYGKRSMGKKRRLSKAGSRQLTEDDFRPDGRPRVIRNPDDINIKTEARFECLVDLDEHQKLMEILDKRGGSQRGKRKCQNPNANPLGGRVFDMACGWSMYKTKYQKNKQQSFKYKCGCYDKSKGKLCKHNCIDGPSAIRFVLAAIQQKLVQPNNWNALVAKIKELASKDAGQKEIVSQIASLETKIEELQMKLDQTAQNMALAKNSDHYEAMSKVYDNFKKQKCDFENDVKKLERSRAGGDCSPDIVGEAIKKVEFLHSIDLDGDSDFALAKEVITLTNAQLFARFQETTWGKKRTVNRISGGYVTFGDAEPPIQKYNGPTDRDHLLKVAEKYAKRKTAKPTGDLAELLLTSGEAGSLGSKSRADRIRTCDLLTPSQTR